MGVHTDAEFGKVVDVGVVQVFPGAPHAIGCPAAVDGRHAAILDPQRDGLLQHADA